MHFGLPRNNRVVALLVVRIIRSLDLLVRVLILGMSISGLHGCVSIVDGYESAMSLRSDMHRNLIEVRHAIIRNPEYATNRECSYNINGRGLGDEGDHQGNYKFTTRRIGKDRIQCVFTDESGSNSTCLITNRGGLIDFNLDETFSGGATNRTTSENYSAVTEEQRSRLKQRGDYVEGATYFVNPLSVILPEFISGNRFRPGATLSVIKNERGNAWGKYIFRGEATYAQRRVFVLDLVSKMPSRGDRTILVGFSLIDTDTFLPVHLAFHAGTNVLLDQKSCAKI